MQYLRRRNDLLWVRNDTLPAALLTNVQNVNVGGINGCAVVGGEVWCWGANLDLSLAAVNPPDLCAIDDGSQVPCALTPQKVPGFGDVRLVSVGYVHSCVLKTDGTVWCWGNNIIGQIGDGTIESRTTPTQVVW